MSAAGLLRRAAQRVRHLPGLRRLDPLWRLARGPYLKLLRRMSPSGVPVTIAGTPLRLDADFATQNWETVEAEAYSAFASRVRPGARIVDVGAHIGTYTLIAALRAGASGRVMAFEPEADTRAALLRHLEWNAVGPRVIVRDCCCGAQAGTAKFYFRKGAEGMNSLLPTAGFGERVVTVVRLDDEIEALDGAPDLVKVDVEGAEFEVLRGAEQTLRRHHPVLLLSLHPGPLGRLGSSEAEILAWLAGLGYATRVLARDYEVHVLAEVAQP